MQYIIVSISSRVCEEVRRMVDPFMICLIPGMLITSPDSRHRTRSSLMMGVDCTRLGAGDKSHSGWWAMLGNDASCSFLMKVLKIFSAREGNSVERTSLMSVFL